MVWNLNLIQQPKFTIMLTTKLKNPAIFFVIVLFPFICAQTQSIRTLKSVPIMYMRLEVDKTIQGKFNSQIPIGITVVSETKGMICTEGFLKGSLKWTDFIISADSAKFLDGTLYVPYCNQLPKTINLTIISKYQPNRMFKDSIELAYFAPIQSESDKKQFQVSVDSVGFKAMLVSNEIKCNRYFLAKKRGSIWSDGNPIPFDVFFSNPYKEVFYYNKKYKQPEWVMSAFLAMNNEKDNRYYSSGLSGLNGFSGFGGSSGSSGFISGPNGSNGANGQNGNDGNNGGNGQDLDVFTDVFYDSLLQTNLIFVEVKNLQTENTSKYIFNPVSNHISIYSFGGDGGDGGDGGNGGDGGSGADGSSSIEIKSGSNCTPGMETNKCAGKGGDGGDGGDGGNGGDGGDGGSITVMYTKDMQPYLDLIKVESNGGSGGDGGDGGSDGDGGRGGSGYHSGSSGSDGSKGSDGSNGNNGNSGKIRYVEIQE
jgi:hypothetical protein